MPAKHLMIASALATAAMLLATPPASADAIDGNWCHTDGRNMSIDGPAIVTPGGTRLNGDYDRHGFRYTVPKAEPGAGAAVSMVLVDDDTIHLTSDAAPVKGRTQVWRRCDLTT